MKITRVSTSNPTILKSVKYIDTAPMYISMKNYYPLLF